MARTRNCPNFPPYAPCNSLESIGSSKSVEEGEEVEGHPRSNYHARMEPLRTCQVGFPYFKDNGKTPLEFEDDCPKVLSSYEILYCFPCKKCDQRFKEKKELVVHRRIHRPIKNGETSAKRRSNKHVRVPPPPVSVPQEMAMVGVKTQSRALRVVKPDNMKRVLSNPRDPLDLSHVMSRGPHTTTLPSFSPFGCYGTQPYLDLIQGIHDGSGVWTFVKQIPNKSFCK